MTREQAERMGGDLLRHAPRPLPGEAVLLEAAKPWKLAHTCSTAYTAKRQSGRRRLEEIAVAVVHCTQGATARSAAAWFANEASRGSAHLVVDALECFRTLPPSVIPWGAPGANVRGWHLEIAGFAEWTHAEWIEHRGALDRAAYKLALHCAKFRIPIVRLSAAQLKRGERGIVGHNEVSIAYGGSHWDPGHEFPWAYLIEQTHHFRKGFK